MFTCTTTNVIAIVNIILLDLVFSRQILTCTAVLELMFVMTISV